MNALLQFCFGCYTDALTPTFSQETERRLSARMRWWEVSRRHGVPIVSHDGSGFDSTQRRPRLYMCVASYDVRRAAEYEAKVPSLPQITVADLPPLSD